MSRIAILLPDGVGLRHFIYSDFIKKLEAAGNEVFVWNGTVFPVHEMGYKEIPLRGSINPQTDIIKKVRKEFELKRSYNLTGNPVYLGYEFRTRAFHSMKIFVKKGLSLLYRYNGMRKVETDWYARKMESTERNTEYYKKCRQQLLEYHIEKVFCTNQRHVLSIAPIVAAKDLGLSTSTFIFSWDNLPKATMIIYPEKYYVWSEYMKKELLFYYPYIKEENVIVVGTPQFMPHFEKNNIMTREDFFASLSLDPHKKYICFSGDDITTSPNDQLYLRDIASQIREYNNTHHENYAILFRKCPVDFSGRYDAIIDSYKDVIHSVDPLWENRGNGWNNAMPTIEDQKLLVNTIHHSIMTVNVGSSIVFDAICHDSPTCYIDYDVPDGEKNWSIEKIYKYIHFNSMPSKNPVYWIRSDHDLITIMNNYSETKSLVVEEAHRWLDIICSNPQNSIDLLVNDLIR